MEQKASYIVTPYGGAVPPCLVRSLSDRAVRVRVLGPVSRRFQKVFALESQRKVLNFMIYRPVLFTYQKVPSIQEGSRRV